MHITETCPRCQQKVSEERLQQLPKICDLCGFVLTDKEELGHRQFERRSLYGVIAAGVLMVLGFIHVVNWGGYALEVIPLKALTMIGLDSTPTQERMTQICLDVKRYDCAEQMMARMASHDKNAYLRLGKFQFSRMKYADAAESYRQFFGSGGQNLDAAYFYARALGEIGHVDESAKYFDYVLAAKPDVLQVTVASNYVKMLVLHGRLDQSLRVIQAIRHRGASARSFMDSEYKVIEARLGHRSS